MGLVLGSRRKEVAVSLSLFIAFNKGESSSLLGESMASRWGRSVARYGGGQGTQLRDDELHRQVLDHSQAVCMHLTPLSSDDVANRSDTVLTTS